MPESSGKPFHRFIRKRRESCRRFTTERLPSARPCCMTDWRSTSHRRYNPLTDEWVLVSPDRLQRPWLGEIAAIENEKRRPYDPQCYLCPGNVRANGEPNPQYSQTYAFDNDFPALQDASSPQNLDIEGLLVAATEPGRCRVVCFSPRHDQDMATMAPANARAVVDAWAQEYRNLGALPFVRAVTIFENRGAMMGASNPHPHGQIWANASIPSLELKEARAQRAYQDAHDACLLCSYLAIEEREQERIVHADEHVTVLVPFWASWPFEVLVLARRHTASLDDLRSEERDALASALQHLTVRYDRLFNTEFPYSMGFHQAPTDGEPHTPWHLHAHYYPPLLRSASIRKYVVGYEMLAQAQRDITPEEAARRLREA